MVESPGAEAKQIGDTGRPPSADQLADRTNRDPERAQEAACVSKCTLKRAPRRVRPLDALLPTTRERGLVDTRRGWYIPGVTFTIELEREEDGRWIAEVAALPGVLCYGQDRDEAVAGVQALALRVIADRLENREEPAEFLNVTFQAA